MIDATRKPSEVIAEFIEYVEFWKSDYQRAERTVKEVDNKETIDILHELEFAANKAERNKIATKGQRSMLSRRKNKDVVDRLIHIVEFFKNASHRNFMSELRQLIPKQQEAENYLEGERVYKPRKEGKSNV